MDVLARQAPFGYNKFHTFTGFYDAGQLARSVQGSPADLFHVHNEPDWMVKVVKDAGGGRPVVFDIHDLESLRWQREPDQNEREAFEAADAYVHVSIPCKQAAERYHASKPNIVLYSWVNEEYIPKHVGDVSWTSICYEGGLSTLPPLEEQEGRIIHNMRSFQPVVAAFVEQGFNVYLFPADGHDPNDLTYENLGAYVAAPTIYPVMLAGLRAFGFGLVGAPASSHLLEAAMPNKLFEYMSQGVVPVCMNASEAARFVEDQGIGIRLDGLENLSKQLQAGPVLRQALLKLREQYTMEAHIGPLVELYQMVWT